MGTNNVITMMTKNIVSEASIATAQSISAPTGSAPQGPAIPQKKAGLVAQLAAADPMDKVQIDWKNHTVAIGGTPVRGPAGNILEALALQGTHLTVAEVTHMVESGVFGRLRMGRHGDVMLALGKGWRPIRAPEIAALVKQAYQAAFEQAELKGRIIFVGGRGVLDSSLIRGPDGSIQGSKLGEGRLSGRVGNLLGRMMRDGACYHGYWDAKRAFLVPLIEAGEVELPAEDLANLWGLRGFLPVRETRSIYEHATVDSRIEALTSGAKGGKIVLGVGGLAPATFA